jgi:transcription elongation factor/antiterminator RfaH
MADKKWYAIYTRPRWEKKVAHLLEEKKIEHYLPLQKILKQWSDRRKWVREPLFRSYVFVHIEPEGYMTVLQTTGVVRFVTFEKKAVAIPPVQIEAIRTFINTGEEMISEEVNMEVGDKVRIKRGPLIGLEGILVSISRKKRVRIMIEGIQQSLHIKVPASLLTVIRE